MTMLTARVVWSFRTSNSAITRPSIITSPQLWAERPRSSIHNQTCDQCSRTNRSALIIHGQSVQSNQKASRLQQRSLLTNHQVLGPGLQQSSVLVKHKQTTSLTNNKVQHLSGLTTRKFLQPSVPMGQKVQQPSVLTNHQVLRLQQAGTPTCFTRSFTTTSYRLSKEQPPDDSLRNQKVQTQNLSSEQPTEGSPNDYKIFYSFPHMRGVRLLARLKLYQTALTIILVPYLSTMYATGSATETQVNVMITIYGWSFVLYEKPTLDDQSKPHFAAKS